MKIQKYPYYPRLKREFTTAYEIAQVINRSESYVWNRLRDPDTYSFTFAEKRLILNHLNKPFNSDTIDEFFGRDQLYVKV